MLETLGPTAQSSGAHERWRELVTALRAALGWVEQPVVIRQHAKGTLLAIAAPVDALLTATEVNEWAWEQASGVFAVGAKTDADPPFDQLHFSGVLFSTVAAAFVARAAAEGNPALAALRIAARQHHVALLADDENISIGEGAGSRTWPLSALPAAASVPWHHLHDIPKILVTGSNGKTTTVRLLAALIAASEVKYRDRVGFSSTEGVVVGGVRVGEGDFSGPAGARLVLRDPRVQAAVLETARGGILRRGLAVERADVAIVTNISADHFGEYGIDSLEDLASVKLVAARALGSEDTLVLNADDPVLLKYAQTQECRIALFARQESHDALVKLRAAGGATCGLDDGQLWLTQNGNRFCLGAIAELPLTLSGAAAYNIGNIAAAALAAAAVGVAPEIIAAELKRFGSTRSDNPGRLNRWAVGGITVLIDYAHNPDGLAMLLAASRSLLRDQHAEAGVEGRLGLLLGQAGNRSDQAIGELARVAAQSHPAFIVIKEIPGMLRGRALGDVPALLKAGLLAGGYSVACIETVADEVDAARRLLHWAKRGDVLVLPVHQAAARDTLAALLDEMENHRWQAGTALPA
ncbi:MAG: hypothetical protein LH481_09545 [Burkholderiales bacterium]|nr:hypothetical protein [Burkholderiales bacterium]